MPQQLDFQGTVSALQALLGRVVSVTIGNFASGNESAVAGVAGVLGYAERPPDEHVVMHGAGEDDQIYTFFLGSDKPFDRAWFTISERSFQWGQLHDASETADSIEESVGITSTGTTIVVAVPTNAHLAEVGWHEPD